MERLQDRRVWLLGGALVTLVIVAVSWILFIGPTLSSTTALRETEATTSTQNANLDVQIAALRTKEQHRTIYTDALARVLDALPPTSALPSFTREVSAHAKAVGVTVGSISVGTISATTPATATSSTATSSTATPNAATGTASPTTPGAPAAVAGSGYTIPITLQTTGSLARQLVFLQRLRLVGPRSVLITSAQFSPASGAKTPSIDSDTTLSIQLSVFCAPQSAAQIAQLEKLLNVKIGN